MQGVSLVMRLCESIRSVLLLNWNIILFSMLPKKVGKMNAAEIAGLPYFFQKDNTLLTIVVKLENLKIRKFENSKIGSRVIKIK